MGFTKFTYNQQRIGSEELNNNILNAITSAGVRFADSLSSHSVNSQVAKEVAYNYTYSGMGVIDVSYEAGSMFPTTSTGYCYEYISPFTDIQGVIANANVTRMEGDATIEYKVGTITPDRYNVSNRVPFTTGFHAKTGSISAIFITSDGLTLFTVYGGHLHSFTSTVPYMFNDVIETTSTTVDANESWYGMFFSPDGLQIFGMTRTDSKIVSHPLSTAWDLSTINFSSGESVTPLTGSGYSLHFSPNGMNLFYTGNNALVYKIPLSTAWDLSTTGTVQSVDLATHQTDVQAITFSDDGLQMFVSETTNTGNINEYSLSTAWDLSTFSFVQTHTGDDLVTRYTLFFAENGAKLFVAYISTNTQGFSLWDGSFTQESAYIDLNEPVDITSFTEDVNGLMIKMTKKTTNPTTKTPAISGLFVKGFN